MKVIPATTTIASFCEELEEGKIVVNRDYQRSRRVWPVKARSYLIDTIVSGFPIPKLSLYQSTDLKSRKTIKEIVDGQQRSMAILDYIRGKYKLSGKTEYSGSTFEELPEEKQTEFLEYQLSLDIFVGATPEQIRQVFRRINSYTIPLNRQELRHATYQGEFKWFIVRIVERYAQTLKEIGCFKETQLSRMRDATLFTEVVEAFYEGIVSSSDNRLDAIYKKYDEHFAEEGEVEELIDQAMSYLVMWSEIHNTPLTKSYNVYALVLAISHYLSAHESLQEVREGVGHRDIDSMIAIEKLSRLSEALLDPEEADDELLPFIEANSKATNRIGQRKVRFQYLYDALS